MVLGRKAMAAIPKRTAAQTNVMFRVDMTSKLCLPVRTVAVRWVFRQFTGAHRRSARRLRFKCDGLEGRPAVSAIAPRLIGRLTATAPEVFFALLEGFDDWGVAR